MSWQYSDKYIGWAALPPTGSGYAFSTNVGAISLRVGAWRFVPTLNFLDNNIHTHIVGGARNPELLRATQPVGSVRVVNNVVLTNVINVTNVERVVKRQVAVHEVVTAEKSGPVMENGQVVRAFQPTITKGSAQGRAEPSHSSGKA